MGNVGFSVNANDSTASDQRNRLYALLPDKLGAVDRWPSGGGVALPSIRPPW
jgi:hypothetical protein